MPVTSSRARTFGSPQPSSPAASGLDASVVADLTAHGLLRPDAAGLHAEPDLRVARAAAGLAAYGVEARHLRPFRTAADREVGLVEQVVGAPPRHGRRPARRRGGPPVPQPARRARARRTLRPKVLTTCTGTRGTVRE